jgi:bifunctional non-homologous end joining protein LigD
MDPLTDGFAELTLEARDLPRLERFYTDGFGLAVLAREPDRVWLAAGARARLGLWVRSATAAATGRSTSPIPRATSSRCGTSSAAAARSRRWSSALTRTPGTVCDVPAAKRMEVEVEGRTLSLSNLDKVFYPKTGFTKGQVIEYYTRVAPALLPHLQDRHLTLKRYPNGVEGEYFYEKQCPGHRPDWVRTAGVWSRHNGREIDYCVADDLSTVVWLANLADLEMHTPLARADAPKQPTVLAFDLDPGPPAGIVECAEVACRLRDAFDHFGLLAFPKTSGSKGMQLYVPLNTPITYKQTKPFAQGVAQVLERRHPELIVSEMRKDRRPGKVFIDWSQNDEHKTTVCVYSLRARDTPTVSTPVTWDEVEGVLRSRDPDELSFTSDEVLARVEEHGDAFASVLELEQELPS